MPRIKTIQNLLNHNVQQHTERPALRSVNGEELSRGSLDATVATATEQLAGWGLERTDRIAISLPNGPEMAVTALAAMSVGVAAPLNPAYRKSEFSYYLKDLAASAVVLAEEDHTECSAAAAELGTPIIRVRKLPSVATEIGELFSDPEQRHDGAVESAQPSDVALVLHTSGTTARPKMVPLSHQNLYSSAANVAKALALTSDDVALNVMPLFHIHGLVAGLLAPLSAEATVVCAPGFLAPHFLDWLQTQRATWYTAVPTMHQGILDRARMDGLAKVDSNLRLIRSSSASLPPTVYEELQNTFGVPVVEAYGMTEAAHQISCNPLPPRERKAGSVGVPAGPEVEVVDDQGQQLPQGRIGEVVIRGENLTSGYWEVEDPTASFLPNGCFRTGDQGYLDVDGYLFLTGRLKEIINRGGETIAPREIEETLLAHEAVNQAVVFAAPHERLGEVVAAAVVLCDGCELSEVTLIRQLGSKLSAAKVPERVLFLDEIPKGATGKVQRIGMAERLGYSSLPPMKTEDNTDEESLASRETVDRIVKLWKHTLQVDAIDEEAEFVAAGGDSVTATLLLLRVREEFDIDVPMTFLTASTVRRQAEVIEDLRSNS